MKNLVGILMGIAFNLEISLEREMMSLLCWVFWSMKYLPTYFSILSSTHCNFQHTDLVTCSPKWIPKYLIFFVVIINNVGFSFNIYLAVLGPSCGTRDLQSPMWQHVGCLVATCCEGSSSLTRDLILPALGMQSLSYWATREVPIILLLIPVSLCSLSAYTNMIDFYVLILYPVTLLNSLVPVLVF